MHTNLHTKKGATIEREGNNRNIEICATLNCIIENPNPNMFQTNKTFLSVAGMHASCIIKVST